MFNLGCPLCSRMTLLFKHCAHELGLQENRNLPGAFQLLLGMTAIDSNEAFQYVLQPVPHISELVLNLKDIQARNLAEILSSLEFRVS